MILPFMIMVPASRLPDRHRLNPFSTRHTRPGAVVPLDRQGVPLDVAAVLGRLDRHPAVAIVGPHGTGKSTLLTAIACRLEEAGRPVMSLRLNRRWDAVAVLQAIQHAHAGTTVLIDGWERMGRLPRILATLIARCRDCRLVVTSHRAAGMPTVWETAGTLPLLAAIVARLPAHDGLIGPADLADSFTRHRGNLRDALGDLYDCFERRARRS